MANKEKSKEKNDPTIEKSKKKTTPEPRRIKPKMRKTTPGPRRIPPKMMKRAAKISPTIKKRGGCQAAGSKVKAA
ncbi:MAG: hypothetical protein GY839_20935 [candidate division Zixibacteria bacterium]|nr:hypothetical protein [candidate division Zixibacteria bacterium]